MRSPVMISLLVASAIFAVLAFQVGCDEKSKDGSAPGAHAAVRGFGQNQVDGDPATFASGRQGHAAGDRSAPLSCLLKIQRQWSLILRAFPAPPAEAVLLADDRACQTAECLLEQTAQMVEVTLRGLGHHAGPLKQAFAGCRGHKTCQLETLTASLQQEFPELRTERPPECAHKDVECGLARPLSEATERLTSSRFGKTPADSAQSACR